ncbi:hypothetical protein C2E23DRAFT_882957 [Lenzites betulinus]|nr:hypothetical protein C2E23DRAFT_882957 [Lenzites betulinus]
MFNFPNPTAGESARSLQDAYGLPSCRPTWPATETTEPLNPPETLCVVWRSITPGRHFGEHIPHSILCASEDLIQFNDVPHDSGATEIPVPNVSLPQGDFGDLPPPQDQPIVSNEWEVDEELTSAFNAYADSVMEPIGMDASVDEVPQTDTMDPCAMWYMPPQPGPSCDRPSRGSAQHECIPTTQRSKKP